MSNQKLVFTSRSSAINCLVQWAGTGKPVQKFIEKNIHNSSLKSEDRQLAVMLVMGVIRRQQYLDIILARFSRTPLRKMKPLTLAALRVGIYQLCFLDRIPDSAAVNETVKALKKARQPGWLLKFVNGTLRAISREKSSLPQPEKAGPDNSLVLEHPDWLTTRWHKKYGWKKMVEMCRINSLEPKTCLQVNTRLTTRGQLVEQLGSAGITLRPGRYSPDSLILPEFRGAVTTLPGFAEGLFQIQDQAANLCCYLLGPLQERERYLDGCAGLGGKTCVLASMLPGGAELHAVEPDLRRFRLMSENLKRQKKDTLVNCSQQDLQSFVASGPTLFNGILVDAPCSGTGVIRKHPDIRWNRSPEDLAVNKKIQSDLLRLAATLLAPGGVLVYATCSLEPEENEQVVEHFLSCNDEFILSDCREFLPESARVLVNDQGMFSPAPSEEIEGFFAVRMVRKL
jgi:16S rRNA (cytosine967-C5)-methyltransferase